MDNLSEVSNAKGAIREVATHRETWVMALLYIGTFGSFIGFSFAFGQVLLVQFPEQFPTPVKAAALTFLGPLLGSLIRPVGGKLADRYSGSRVTFWNFVAMALGTGVVLIAASQLHSLPLYVVGFTMLFVFSGLGNGSTYKMIPAIFQAKAQSVEAGMPIPDADAEALRRSGALIGLAGAIGALGGVGVNLAFRQSFLSLGNANGAYLAFIGCYAICMAVTWFWFIRPRPAPLAGCLNPASAHGKAVAPTPWGFWVRVADTTCDAAETPPNTLVAMRGPAPEGVQSAGPSRRPTRWRRGGGRPSSTRGRMIMLGPVLEGARVLVTAQRRADDLAAALIRRGAQVDIASTLGVEPHIDEAGLLTTTAACACSPRTWWW